MNDFARECMFYSSAFFLDEINGNIIGLLKWFVPKMYHLCTETSIYIDNMLLVIYNIWRKSTSSFVNASYICICICICIHFRALPSRREGEWSITLFFEWSASGLDDFFSGHPVSKNNIFWSKMYLFEPKMGYKIDDRSTATVVGRGGWRPERVAREDS